MFWILLQILLILLQIFVYDTVEQDLMILICIFSCSILFYLHNIKENIMRDVVILRKKISLLNKMNEHNYEKYCDELKKKQDFIKWLDGKEKEYREVVITYEEKLRNTPKSSAYYQIHLKTIRRFNARREMIKEAKKKVEELV